MSEMIERVATAMEEAAFGYSMNLVRLVDGVSTYRLKYSDGELLEFGSTDEVYEHVAEKKRRTQARAAIEAMREPTEEMGRIVREKIGGFSDSRMYREFIDAALKEETP